MKKIDFISKLIMWIIICATTCYLFWLAEVVFDYDYLSLLVGFTMGVVIQSFVTFSDQYDKSKKEKK